METIEKVIIGLILFVITSVLAYLFRMRQLYVVAPKLYRYSPVSEKGSLCEIIAYNKGKQVEENIQIALDPELKYELLAASTGEITIDGPTIKIERLHRDCEGSAMLLVENGVLDFTKIISISSKETKGKVFKRITEVPPNFANFSVSIFLILGFLPALIYGERLVDHLKAVYVEYQLKPLKSQGWSNLNSYYSSDLKESYSNQEFPIRYIEQRNDGETVEITYEIYNKTATILNVYAKKLDAPYRDGEVPPYFSSADIAPMSKQTLKVSGSLPKEKSSAIKIEFSFKLGDEFINGMAHKIELGSVNNSKEQDSPSKH